MAGTGRGTRPAVIPDRRRSRLKWEEVSSEPHAELLRWYTDLIRLRREVPDLADPRLDRIRVEHDESAQTVVVHRGEHVVVVNLADQPRDVEISPFDAEPPALEVLLAWAPDVVVEPILVRMPAESAAVLRAVAG